VTYVNHNNFALNYALPSWGYESFDYHPSKGLFFIGNVFNNEVTSFNPTGSAQDSRPNLAGGRGYPPVETYTLGMNNFTFGSNPAVASNLREFGLNSLGTLVDIGENSKTPGSKPRNRLWVCRCQFWYVASTFLNCNFDHPAHVL